MALSDLPGILEMVLWGALATAAMTGMMQGALGLGLSRLSIPFMVGAMFSGNRRMATVVGVALYILGGWAFAFLYILMLTSLNRLTWWAGGLLGLVHGLVLLVAALPPFPMPPPRIASALHPPPARQGLATP